MLKKLLSLLTHSSEEQVSDIAVVIQAFPELFNDIPTRTNMLCHDIDVAEAIPIKQHAYRVNPARKKIMSEEVAYTVYWNMVWQNLI